VVIDPSDFHWLIGLLEGEGTFLAGPPSNPGLPIVRVSMTDHDVVQRVARLLDRAVVALRARRQHHKTPFAATIKGAPAVDLMLAVHDFISVKRRTQIERAIRSWHKRRSRWRRSPGPCAASGCRCSRVEERSVQTPLQLVVEGSPLRAQLSHLPARSDE